MKIQFQETPSMPSYLTCWSIGRYDHISGCSADGVPVRLFTPVGKGEEGKLGLEVSRNISNRLRSDPMGWCGGAGPTVFFSIFKFTLVFMNHFQVAIKALDYYKSFFGVGYTLPKMDLIAIPDFAIGAMENWGLLTFRESFLLAREDSSAHSRQWVALIVAHEVAHQVH